MKGGRGKEEKGGSAEGGGRKNGEVRKYIVNVGQGGRDGGGGAEEVQGKGIEEGSLCEKNSCGLTGKGFTTLTE